MVDFASLLSEQVLSLHEEGIDAMIESDIADVCTIHYPPIWVDGTVTDDGIGGKPQTINLHGRHVPISPNGNSTFQGAESKIQEDVTETCRGLVYWSVGPDKEWQKAYETQVQVANDVIEIITYRTNILKFLRSNYVEVSTRLGQTYKYKLANEPKPAGFRAKYIRCTLVKVN